MATWHNRLDEALKKRGKTWPDLVTVTGLKKPSVYAWKPDATRRSTMMDGENAAVVCHYLHINAMWLFHNHGPSGIEDEPKALRLIAAERAACYGAEADDPEDEKTLVEGYRAAPPDARHFWLDQARHYLEISRIFDKRSEQ
jgi:hypothetical protein